MTAPSLRPLSRHRWRRGAGARDASRAACPAARCAREPRCAARPLSGCRSLAPTGSPLVCAWAVDGPDLSPCCSGDAAVELVAELAVALVAGLVAPLVARLVAPLVVPLAAPPAAVALDYFYWAGPCVAAGAA